MAEPKAYKVGEAPWEVDAKSSANSAPSFKVGEAPWEKAEPEAESKWRTIPRAVVDTVAPVGGAIIGGLLATPETFGMGTIPGAGVGWAAGKAAAKIANHYMLGDELENKTMLEGAKASTGDVAEGVAAEMGGQLMGKAAEVAAPYASRVLNKVGEGASSASKSLRATAKDAALNATGATGAQSAKFADDAGEQLLDRGHVRFFDNPEKIAKRVDAAMTEAEGKISGSLNSLDAKGVKVDPEILAQKIKGKIRELRADPSKSDITRQLETELENLTNANKAKMEMKREDLVTRLKETDPTDVAGVKQIQSELAALKTEKPSFGMNEAEGIKRGYQRKAGNWMDPDKSQAGKEMYQTYRGAVEDAAMESHPELAQTFKEGKETYGLLAPIQEAAERRAATTRQSPIGNLKDMVAAGVTGAATGNPALGIATAVGHRVVAPRISSSIAVTANNSSKAMGAAAKFLQTSPELAALAAKNPAAFRELATGIAAHMDSGATLPMAAKNEQVPGELDRDSSKSSMEDVMPESTPAPQTEPKPEKGTKKWISEGYDNVAKHDPALSVDKTNPKIQSLLIAASDLKPGSRAMNDIVSRLKKYDRSN